MDQLAAKRYAKALFDLAIESNEMDKFHEASEAVLSVIENDKEFMNVINHPDITYEQKLALVENVFRGLVPDAFVGLFVIVLKKNREEELPGIFRFFHILYMDYKKIAVAEVYSATDLNETQVNEIKQTIAGKINKQVEVRVTVEPALIAGIRIEVDGRVIDGSVKKQMELLKQQLMSLQLV